MDNNDEMEWVSMSELAQRVGCSVQTIRNKCKQGLYETMTFKRGCMNGILVKTRRLTHDTN